ncbi:MAG: multiple sugar transport system permease protein [Thermomicrobiales bacterium]|nr:multiple sugar transport system permease protein [Thermomicrobiales bacterium]MEA2586533.1 multiple sugar transport system permease protein [Thermomicrobiales bacterium]
MARAVDSRRVAVGTPARGTFLSRVWRHRLQMAVAFVVILAGAAIIIMPLGWMISTSLKRQMDVFVLPPKWIPAPPQWGNYAEIFDSAPFDLYLLNSAIITSSSVFGSVLSCSLAAYGFARLRFPGRELIFVMILATLMLPESMTLIPRFIIFEKLGWLNSFKPLIVPSFFGSAFQIFLLRQFFRTIPNELEDAARLDGAGTLRIFATIVLPLSKPALVTAGIFSFIFSWNDFIRPLLYLNSEDKYTVAIGLLNFTGSDRIGPQMHLLMAASFLTTLPVLIVFLLAQRLFVKGIVFSGIKG